METSLDIYSYLDYRAFCRDFYCTQKATNPKFSYRSFAKKAVVASSYLKHVMDGIRNLSPEMAIKFGHGMDLSGKEIDYFENLVRFNQAASLDEKSLYFERLRRKRARALRPLGLAEAVDLLSNWYVVAIKEIVVNLNTDDVKVIQRVLRRKLTEHQIQKTIDDLKTLGWLSRTENGWASQIQFPDEVKSYVIRSFHQQMLELAIEALGDEISDREYGAAVFTFPASELPALKEKIKELQRELVSFVQDLSAHSKSRSDHLVYHFGVQCFSLQKTPDRSIEKEVDEPIEIRTLGRGVES